MKISVLCNNWVGTTQRKEALAEWGLSLYIENGEHSFLLDVGNSGVFAHNASLMGIDLDTLRTIVLSHRHWDHTGGFKHRSFAPETELIFHPHMLQKLPRAEAQHLQENYLLTLSIHQKEFYPDTFFLGKIQRQTNFEAGSYKGDPMIDDTAVAIRTKLGTIVLTGCAHSGICNICLHAKEVCGEKLYAVIGGFHLKEKDQKQLEETIKFFKSEKVQLLAPMHCVDTRVLSQLDSSLGIVYLGAGDTLAIGE